MSRSGVAIGGALIAEAVLDTAPTAIASVTFADIAGASISVDTGGGRAIELEMEVVGFQNTLATAAAGGTLILQEDGVTILNAPITYYSVASVIVPGIHRVVVRTPAAGAHTYKLQWKCTNATNTVSMWNSGLAVCAIRARYA